MYFYGRLRAAHLFFLPSYLPKSPAELVLKHENMHRNLGLHIASSQVAGARGFRVVALAPVIGCCFGRFDREPIAGRRHLTGIRTSTTPSILVVERDHERISVCATVQRERPVLNDRSARRGRECVVASVKRRMLGVVRYEFQLGVAAGNGLAIKTTEAAAMTGASATTRKPRAQLLVTKQW